MFAETISKVFVNFEMFDILAIVLYEREIDFLTNIVFIVISVKLYYFPLLHEITCLTTFHYRLYQNSPKSKAYKDLFKIQAVFYLHVNRS